MDTTSPDTVPLDIMWLDTTSQDTSRYGNRVRCSSQELLIVASRWCSSISSNPHNYTLRDLQGISNHSQDRWLVFAATVPETAWIKRRQQWVIVIQNPKRRQLTLAGSISISRVNAFSFALARELISFCQL